MDYSYREFFIPKRNGTKRRICAPSPDLLRVQRGELHSLEQFFLFLEDMRIGYPCFQGFIKNRNIVTCAEQHVGFNHTITLDISNCFDSITRQMLEENISYDLNSKCFHKDGSLAQGFATSPILANIYLISPLEEIIEAVNYYEQGIVVTCYADDIQISLNTSSDRIHQQIIQIVTSIMKKHKLEINKKKTRIRHKKYGNRKILGIMVGETLTPSRKLKKKIRAARHQSNGPSLGGLITASRNLRPKALR